MTDKQLLRIAHDLRKGILGKKPSADMCMVVSAPLQGMLSALYGFQTKLEEVWFDETPQGTTNLDATADQFGLEPVYLGPMPELYQAGLEGTQE